MIRRKTRILVALALAVLLAAAGIQTAFGAAPYLSVQQKVAEAGTIRFGTSVSCSGSTVVVGGEGAAVVYTRYHNSWSLLQGLATGEPSAVADMYGAAVDVDAGVAVVGAPMNNGGAGAAYVFTRSGTTWYYTQKLQASDAEPGDHFGATVTIDGATISIGAPEEDAAATDAGAVYVFTRPATVWGETQKLMAPDAAAGDGFGDSACLDNATLVVGAPHHDTSAIVDAGEAYAYTMVGGIFGAPQLLVQYASNKSEAPQTSAMFGDGVAVRGNTILIGATGSSGGAFVFVKSTTWIPQSALPLPAFDGSERYGCSVALCTDAALVGGNMENGGKGAAAFFIRSGETWSYNKTLVGADSAPGDEYGSAVDLYCSVAVVGAPGAGGVAGSAYLNTTLEAVPVYRFYNTRTGTHFYTDSQAERDFVRDTYSQFFSYEGVAYMTNPGNNDHPLYRFYNFRNGSHFYTADAAEAESVKANLGGIYSYDGPTYAVSLYPAADKIPVYRFYNARVGAHFYTADPAERDNVIATLGYIYQYEGVAFYLGQ